MRVLNQDNDQDGIPNRFDLDSDGDGCLDVIEAGFLDANEISLVQITKILYMLIP